MNNFDLNFENLQFPRMTRHLGNDLRLCYFYAQA